MLKFNVDFYIQGIKATHVLGRDMVLSEEAPDMCVFGPNLGGTGRFSYKWYRMALNSVILHK